MTTRRMLQMCLAPGVAVAACAAAIAAEDVPAGPWYRDVKLNGYVSVSYGFNANHPASGQNDFHVFDTEDRSSRLDVANLVLHKDATKAGEFEFRIDAAGGQSIPHMTAATGLFRDPDTGRAHDYDVQQAYLGYIVPLGSGLHLAAGKFISHMGYEAIDRWDGINDNASRSFLFGYAVPFTQTGLRASYTFSPQLTTTAYVLNGWDTVRNDRALETFGAQVAVTASDKVSFLVNYIGGPEQAQDTSNIRRVYDLCVYLKPSPRLSLGFNTSYGREPGAAADGGAARWSGAAVYATLGLGGAWSVALRGEVFDDADGVRTGVVQKLREITLTPAYHFSNHVIVRADLRMDYSDQPVFDGDARKKRQPTLLLNAALPF